MTNTILATGGTITTSGGNTIHTFNSSGTWTVTGIPAIYTLSVTAGSYALTGKNVAFSKGWHFLVSVGQYVLTGLGLREDRETGWTRQQKDNTIWTNEEK